MKQFGLIGFPLSHSFSPAWFNQKFKDLGLDDHYYQAFPIPDLNEFPILLAEHPNLVGLNVTIPYKEKILSYLDSIDPVAREIGAVNTIKISEGKTTGFNTDVDGFSALLKMACPKKPGHAFILGSGGAAKAVKYVLNKEGIPFTVVSTSGAEGSIRYIEVIDLLKNSDLFINTTPLGMHPDVSSFPSLPYQLMNQSHVLIDLVYNPEETEFMKKGKSQGARTFNGMLMLIRQAEEAWRIWSNC